MNSASRDRLVKLIDRALAGEVSLEEVMNLCPSESDPEPLGLAWHAVMHFVTDEDIRSRDSAYDAWSHAELQRFRRKLLEGD